jgi:nucleotide-binding universal stress UspA family protein
VIAAETPAEGILAFARERESDLIVLSAMGVSAVRAILLGSNTRKVVRGSASPVLVIPASNRVTAEDFLGKALEAPRPEAAQQIPMPASGHFRNILVATDFSAASAPAVERAIFLAREGGADLTVAHAYQPPSLILDGYVPPPTYEKWDHSLEENARKKLERVVENAKRAGVRAIPLLLTGTPYEAIIEAAGDLHCDLVITGTHGRTGVSRFFLGSVASRVVSAAPCPVMTVHA